MRRDCHLEHGTASVKGIWCGITFELTGPLRRDGLARAGRMYRVPQTGPRRPAVVGPVVQRGVMPRPHLQERTRGFFSGRATEATPSRLTAEQGRYSAAAVNATAKRLAARGAVNANSVDLNLDRVLVATVFRWRLGSSFVLRRS